MSTISELKSGAPLVRAMGLGSFFAARQSAFVGAWTHYSFMARALQSWSSHVGGMLAFVLGSTTALYIVGNRSMFSAELGGLALTYAAVVPYFINIVSEMFVQMRTAFAALERLLEYMELPQEPPHTLESDPPHAAWPIAGRIEFRQLCMRYRPGLPLALTELTATVPAGSKEGIVGRTGAGKSTLVLALFRLVEPASGSIVIDGQTTTELGLHALRRAMTIIPQDPVLHEGTVSHNLCPFGTIPDEQLRSALVRARLPAKMLHAHVAKGGSNLSSGERQLLCFARAMLGDAKILILDEATSNLDEGSDAAMQALLKDEFAEQVRGYALLRTASRGLAPLCTAAALCAVGESRALSRLCPHPSPGVMSPPPTTTTTKSGFPPKPAITLPSPSPPPRQTLLTIAHRLMTVADYDSLLVLGAGKLLEHGSPSSLLSDPASVLSSMAAALGDAGCAALVDKAAKGRSRA